MVKKLKSRARAPLEKKARRGFRGYPVATVAFYGPSDELASKVAVGIVPVENAEADPLERWFSNDRDVRRDPTIGQEILDFTRQHGVRTVVMTDRIIGCPHEEESTIPTARLVLSARSGLTAIAGRARSFNNAVQDSLPNKALNADAGTARFNPVW